MVLTYSRRNLGIIAIVLIGIVVIATYISGWNGGDVPVAIPAN